MKRKLKLLTALLLLGVLTGCGNSTSITESTTSEILNQEIEFIDETNLDTGAELISDETSDVTHIAEPIADKDDETILKSDTKIDEPISSQEPLLKEETNKLEYFDTEIFDNLREVYSSGTIKTYGSVMNRELFNIDKITTDTCFAHSYVNFTKDIDLKGHTIFFVGECHIQGKSISNGNIIVYEGSPNFECSIYNCNIQMEVGDFQCGFIYHQYINGELVEQPKLHFEFNTVLLGSCLSLFDNVTLHINTLVLNTTEHYFPSLNLYNHTGGDIVIEHTRATVGSELFSSDTKFFAVSYHAHVSKISLLEGIGDYLLFPVHFDALTELVLSSTGDYYERETPNGLTAYEPIIYSPGITMEQVGTIFVNNLPCENQNDFTIIENTLVYTRA